jgi:hypothetical protein
MKQYADYAAGIWKGTVSVFRGFIEKIQQAKTWSVPVLRVKGKGNV